MALTESVRFEMQRLRGVAEDVLRKLRQDAPVNLTKGDGVVRVKFDADEDSYDLPSMVMHFVMDKAREEELPIVAAVEAAAKFRASHAAVKTGSTSPMPLDYTPYIPRRLEDFIPVTGEMLDDSDFTLADLQELFKEAFHTANGSEDDYDDEFDDE